jgi:TolA-binding protein
MEENGNSMRLLKALSFVGIICSFGFGQTISPDAGAGNTNVLDELNKLRQTMAGQQKSIVEQQKSIADQQKSIADQQRQIAAQEQEIERLRQQLGAQPQNSSAQTPTQFVHATLNTSASNAMPRSANDTAVQDRPKESPLSFRIGGADFTPGGWVDFENIFRTTNTGNAATTSFGAIPFSNTAAGHLTEFRSTAQYSRMNLTITEKIGANDVTGYVETDFNGNDAATVFQATNPHTMRLRLYWLDIKRRKWEFLGGQSWSWLTPNRNGLSPVPSDLATTVNEDSNINVGVHHTRAAQFRVAYHPNNHWAMGVALENPDQFVGTAAVTFPAAFASGVSNLNGQFDNGNAGVPNIGPDIIPKIAYDTNLAGRHFHAEAAGLLTTAKVAVQATGATSFTTHATVGGGIEAASNFELFKRFRLLANGIYSDGAGRYLIATGPEAVVLPTATGTDVKVSMIHSGGGLAGFEAQVTPNSLLAGYYGGFYFQRNFALDNTAGAKPNTFAGYGGPGSLNSDNRAIQEATADWIQTLWKSDQYGSLRLNTQFSYLTRAPWFVVPGTPKNAHLGMSYISLRYLLP